MSRWLCLALEVATAPPAVAYSVPIVPLVPIAKPEVGSGCQGSTQGGAIGTIGTIGTTSRKTVEPYSGPFVEASMSLSSANPTADDARWQQAENDALAFLTDWAIKLTRMAGQRKTSSGSTRVRPSLAMTGWGSYGC
jgi:hypothetical protein